jgi:hypothetical protein
MICTTCGQPMLTERPHYHQGKHAPGHPWRVEGKFRSKPKPSKQDKTQQGMKWTA